MTFLPTGRSVQEPFISIPRGTDNHDVPSYGTFWRLLTKMAVEDVAQALRGWGRGEQPMALDGNILRGSKRAGAAALRVVVMAGQTLRNVLAQERGDEGRELAAAVRRLEAEDLEGEIVSADAGLLQAPLGQKVVEKGGPLSVSCKATIRA